MTRYQPVTPRTKKNQRSDKNLFGAGTSAVEVITKGEFKTDTDTTKSDKRIQFFGNITCPKEIPITAVEISSGQNEKKTRTPEEH